MMVLKAPHDEAPACLSYLTCYRFSSHCTLAILSPLFLEPDPLFSPQGLYVFRALRQEGLFPSEQAPLSEVFLFVYLSCRMTVLSPKHEKIAGKQKLFLNKQFLNEYALASSVLFCFYLQPPNKHDLD